MWRNVNEFDFQKRLWLSSVPLVCLNRQRMPTGVGSGCLIDYDGRIVLHTVSHVTGDQKNWAIQVRYVPKRGTGIYQLGPMHFLTKVSLPKAALEDVDFAYVEIPRGVPAYRQEIELRSNRVTVKSETAVTIHAASSVDIPNPAEKFGFCGIITPTLENHFGEACLGGELGIYSGLSFTRTAGDYHVFSLPFPHPGHERFRGCSGAPILSTSGSLVALVCGGCEETNEIWGIAVTAFKIAIDILVGNAA
jgi:hypothetical protein